MEAPATRSDQATVISRGMVTLMRQIAGRGPTRARTTIGREHVLVMFSETLNQGERNLVEGGMPDRVEAIRAGYQDLLRADASKLIEDTINRRVVGFMSANSLEPDLAAEVFVLDGTPESSADAPQEAEHSGA